MLRRLFPLLMMISIYPLGTAGQNIGAGIASAILLIWLFSRHPREWWRELKEVPLKWAFLFSALYISWVFITTLLAPWGTAHSGLSFFFGYLYWVFLPPGIYLIYGGFSDAQWQKLWRWTAVIAFVWGLVALSQNLFGWHVSGTRIIFEGHRARGFYSHPLTFAYATLLFWPLAVTSCLRWPRSPYSWLLLSGTALSLWTSESRTVQCVALAVLIVNIFMTKKRGLRYALVGIVIAAVLGIALTDNPIAGKYRQTFQGVHDRQTAYADDRLAFWDANYRLWLKRPLLGYGAEVPHQLRDDVYDELGLTSIEKKYASHNMFLELLVESGIVGLFLYLGWQIFILKDDLKQRSKTFGSLVALQTWIALAVAGLTQNAFQDAEVRLGMAFVATAVWLKGGKPRGHSGNSNG